MIVVWVFLWAIAACLLLLLLMLALPVHLRGDLDTSSAQRFRGQLKLFGGLTPWIDVSSTDEKQIKPPQRARRAGSGLKPHTVGRLIHAAPTTIRSLIRPIRASDGTLALTFGSGDPAETGEFFGLCTPVVYGASTALPFSVVVLPDFDERRFDVQASLAFRAVPLAFVPPIFAFVWRVWGPRL